MIPSEAAAAHEERVRIGPISLFTLIAVISLAVLAVLAFSTANASLIMTQRQADSVAALYQNEAAAQQFVADVDDALAGAGSSGAAVVAGMLDAACSDAEAAVDGQVTATASMQDDVVHAEFTSANGRGLVVEVTIRENATYRIDMWKVTAVQNEEEPQGNFLIVG